jgi:hypothetical protein
MESINTRFYGKRDDFNFPIVNFRFICSNILAAPAYGVYISQLIRYSRTCGSYKDFLDRGLQLTRNPLNQGFNLVEVITLKVRVTWSLVLCVCFVDRCLSFCPISFGHCVVCLVTPLVSSNFSWRRPLMSGFILSHQKRTDFNKGLCKYAMLYWRFASSIFPKSQI